jgi:hypothetical protein
LVVIIILTTIVAAAIPVLSPADDARRIREASRSLNTFLTGAQARAISLGRPFGVALKRLAQDNDKDGNPLNPHEDAGVCLEVFYVEQQPPYSGFDANSRACVALHPDFPGYCIIRFVTRGTVPNDNLPPGWDADELPGVQNTQDTGGVIRPGDVLEINGTRFELLRTPTNNRVPVRLDFSNTFFMSTTGETSASPYPQMVARPINDSGQQLSVKHDNLGYELLSASGNAERPYWTAPAPYKILRQATPTSDEPYQLPETTAIDLRASGVGTDDYFYWPAENDNSQGVIIMFSPEGRVARVQYSQYPITSSEPPAFDQPVTDNIYLLVGKRENIPAKPAADDPTLNAAAWTGAATDEKRAEMKEGVNWLSGNSQWIIIGSQSGRIATIENAAVDPLEVINRYTQSPTSYAQNSEQLRCGQIIAAREFTRTTSQLGGR